MMRYIFTLSRYALLPIVFLLTNSCGKDFLDLKPYESLAVEEATKTLDDLDVLLRGVYDQYQNSDYYGRYFILVPDVMSDDVKQNASANRAKEWAEYNGNALDFIPEEIWTEVYEAINRANTVINANIAVPPTAETRKNQIVGEALALRALSHFDLVRIYAQHYGYTDDNSHLGIPYVKEFDQNAEPARMSVREVYDNILADLDEAIRLMSDEFDANRMNKIAAQAILARVYLYMSDWQNAANMATQVIESGVVSLTPTEAYVDAWRSGTPPDGIFSIAFDDIDNNGSNALGRMYIVEGYGDYLPALDLVNLIDSSDVRIQLFKNTGPGGLFGDLRVDKFPSVIGDDDIPVVRLSEIYLIRAEARAMLGDEDGARADVNVIRLRANPNATPITSSGQQLLDDIEREKRIELMFEGHRLWELMRKKRGVYRNDCTSVICEIPYPNDRFILPIPQAEIDANRNMVQNPGY